MPEPVPFSHRAEIASGLVELNPDSPWLHSSPAGLVLSAGHTDRYIDRALTETGAELGAGSPRHWYFVFPASTYSLDSVEFGTSHADITGQPSDEARFDHEFVLDQTIELNTGNPAVDELYSQIGGIMVEAVRESGHEFFAGLEVRYRKQEDNEIVRWVHLVYSRALLATGRTLKEQMKPEGKYPSWMKKAILPTSKKIVAENMALSALAAARR